LAPSQGGAHHKGAFDQFFETRKRGGAETTRSLRQRGNRVQLRLPQGLRAQIPCRPARLLE